MMSEKKNRTALATVCTPNFIKGTQVLFYSFLRHNPTFKGDLIIICTPDLLKHKERFSQFPNLIFHPISECLTITLDKIYKSYSKLQAYAKPLFYSLEAFNLSLYKRVIFLDSDMIVTKPLEPLFKLSNGLHVWHERAHYLNFKRSKINFALIENSTINHDVFNLTFNSGMMVIGEDLLNQETLNRLLNTTEQICWDKMSLNINDQISLNFCFEGKFTILSPSYNFINKLAQEIELKSHVIGTESNIIHYIGYPKPWQFKRIVKDLLKLKPPPPYFKFWFLAFVKLSLHKLVAKSQRTYL